MRGSRYYNHLDCSILLAYHTYVVDRDGGESGVDVNLARQLKLSFHLITFDGNEKGVGYALGAQVLCGMKLRTASRQFDEQVVVYLQAADKRSDADSVGWGLLRDNDQRGPYLLQAQDRKVPRGKVGPGYSGGAHQEKEVTFDRSPAEPWQLSRLFCRIEAWLETHGLRAVGLTFDRGICDAVLWP
jgi:hypothetical protein